MKMLKILVPTMLFAVVLAGCGNSEDDTAGKGLPPQRTGADLSKAASDTNAGGAQAPTPQ